MSLFSFAAPPAPDIELASGPLVLRPPCKQDFSQWTKLRLKSRAHLTRWEPAWRDDDMTRKAFHQRLARQLAALRNGSAAVFLAFLKPETEASAPRLVGGVTLSNIRFGAAQSATIGYWIGAPFIRQGYGLAAVTGAAAYGFDRLALNRVEAACQPGNEASRRLLKRAGFVEEGLARDYLKINDKWRDHLLFALTARDYRNAQ